MAWWTMDKKDRIWPTITQNRGNHRPIEGFGVSPATLLLVGDNLNNATAYNFKVGVIPKKMKRVAV